MELWKNGALEKWKFRKRELRKNGDQEKWTLGKKGNWTLGKMVFGENFYWEKQKFGTIEVWKNGFSDNANLEK